MLTYQLDDCEQRRLRATKGQGGFTMDDNGIRIDDGLSPEELRAEVAEALPERAAMSTVSMTGLDAATGMVEAVSDGVTETAAATADPEMTTAAAPDAVETAEPVEATTTAAPEPTEVAPEPVEATTTAAPEPAEAAPEATTTAAPEPAEQAHGGGPSANAVEHANQHSHVAQQAGHASGAVSA